MTQWDEPQTVEPGAVRAIVESELSRDDKLKALSQLILGSDEPASVPELFAALRGFAPADYVNQTA